MIIIDNYFNNIDLVRACGLDAEYYPPNENEHFGGYRSPRITEDTNIGKMLNDKIVKTLEDRTGKFVSDIKIYFHCFFELALAMRQMLPTLFKMLECWTSTYLVQCSSSSSSV